MNIPPEVPEPSRVLAFVRRGQIRRAIAQAAVSREDLGNNSPVDAWILAAWDLQDEVDRLHAARSEDHATFAQQLREVDAEVAELNAQLKSALVAATGLSNRVVKAEADNERLRKILRGRGLV